MRYKCQDKMIQSSSQNRFKNREQPCASKKVHNFTLVYFGRKFSILCPNVWFMAQSSEKQKQVAVLAQTVTFVHPKEKNLSIAHAMMFKRAREMHEETNVKMYADYPCKRNKRKKETRMA